MNIENLLHDMFLEMADEEQPPPPSRFLHHGGRGSRRHGLALATATATATAAAVAVVVGGATFMVHGLSSRSGTPARSTSPASTPKTSAWPAPPIMKVWPQAVRIMPKKLPNGRRFHPDLFLDSHTVLARTGKGNSVDRSGFWAYDVDSDKARRLFDFIPPPKTDYTSPAVSGEGRLVWWTVSWGKVKGALDIWTAPVTGGVPHKVTGFEQTMKYGDIDYLAIVNGKVVWSRAMAGGVHQAPLSGGRPEPIPGAEGLHLLQWPWAGSSPAPNERPTIPNFSRLTNIRTGERRVMVKPGQRSGPCSFTWCLEFGLKPIVWRRDGSEKRTLPARPEFRVPALDRFIVLRAGGPNDSLTMVLYDLSTGRVGDFGLHPRRDSKAASAYAEGLYLDYRFTNLSYDFGGKQVIVNLAAIT